MDTLEIWKDIIGYEGLYQVSSYGRIWSVNSDKERKAYDNKGYLYVLLWKDGQAKHKSVHRLVAQAFLPDYSEDLDVNHLDEDKHNNNISNLAMCTRKENLNYGTHNARIAEKLRNNTNRSKKVLCLTNGVIYPSIAEAAIQLNLCSGNISKCCLGKRKQTGGYQFQYI